MAAMSVTQPVDVPIAFLPSISLEKLQSNDNIESSRLFNACTGHGFFYLDLTGSDEILQEWNQLLQFMSEYFAQPLETKLKDDCKSDTYGYEPAGTSAGARVDDVDAYESLKVSLEEIRSSVPAKSATGQKNRALFAPFILNANKITMIILDHLSKMLKLSGKNHLASHHREGHHSLSTMAMFRYPRQEAGEKGLGHNKHTDLGTLTFLLSRQWGLQVLCPEKKCWSFVEPRHNCAIINVGDTLRFLSGNELKSAIHKVIPITMDRQLEDRYSIAYFLRAEDNVTYTDSNGRGITAKEWHDRKFDVFRESHASQEMDSILTGGMEKLGVLI